MDKDFITSFTTEAGNLVTSKIRTMPHNNNKKYILVFTLLEEQYIPSI